MRGKARLAVHALLRHFGYCLNRIDEPRPVDARLHGNHPLSLLYHGNQRPVLIDAPICDGVGLRVIPLKRDGVHPYVLAVMEALATGDVKDSVQWVLEAYYGSAQPRNAAEWLGLTESDAPVLAGAPPWAVLMPWDIRTVEQWRQARENFALQENQRMGVDLTINEGWHFWGPVAPQKLDIEVARFRALLDSVQEKGLQRHDGIDGDIGASVLLRGDREWRWQVTGGEHRAAVYSALGYESVPVRVLQVVNRDDVELWPNVISGVFSPQAALDVFDLIFEGALPAVLQPWSGICDNQYRARMKKVLNANGLQPLHSHPATPS